MKNLINFFFSFDKLMKHKLVPLFFWAALVYLAIWFARDILELTFFTSWLAWLTGWAEKLAALVMVLIGLRLACELAIAIFRISDNLSADGGASDLADIDPLGETRRAAEEAAKLARDVTGKAVDKTKEVASNLKESAEKKFDKSSDTSSDAADKVFEKPSPDPKPEPKPKPKTTSTKKKTTSKKTTTKKPKSET